MSGATLELALAAVYAAGVPDFDNPRLSMSAATASLYRVAEKSDDREVQSALASVRHAARTMNAASTRVKQALAEASSRDPERAVTIDRALDWQLRYAIDNYDGALVALARVIEATATVPAA